MVRLCVVGTFALEPLPLEEAAKGPAVEDTEIKCAGFNQLLQCLYNPAELFLAGGANVNIAFVRPEDCPEEDLQKGLDAYAGATSTPLALLVCPPKRYSPALSPPPCVTLVNVSDVITFSDADLDSVAFKVGVIPYTAGFYRRLAGVALRVVSFLRRPPFKIAVVDCDNTLWQGVVGEDGPAKLVGNLALQKALAAAEKKGLLLVTASKNVSKDVEAAFRAHPDWPLQYESFTAHRETWEKKSAGILSAMRDLNVTGQESVVFIDDNPLEIAEVQASCPGVTTCLYSDTDGFAEHLWPLDRFKATAEDAQRTQGMREEAARKDARNAHTSYADFLASLQVCIDVSVLDQGDHMRAVQMTQRMNQFNFTTRRLESVAGLSGLCVRVKDRFGNYGLVGLVLYELKDVLRVDNFLMSCRVLGRGVEHAMMAAVGQEAEKKGVRVVLEFAKSERNEPAEKFLAEVGLLDAATGRTELEAAKVAAVAFHPEKYREAETQVDMTSAAPFPASAYEERAKLEMAAAQGTVLAASAAGGTALQVLRAAFVEVTGHEPHFDLNASLMLQGLDSVRAVRILSILRKTFPDKELDVSDLLQKPTLLEWVELLEGNAVARDSPEWKHGFVFRMVKGKDQSLAPLVLIHPMSGLLGAWTLFVKKFGDERDIFGVEHPHFSGRMEDLYVTLADVGRMYADAILHQVEERSFVLMAYSGGGIYWAETLQALRHRKRLPALACLVDGMFFQGMDALPVMNHALGQVCGCPQCFCGDAGCCQVCCCRYACCCAGPCSIAGANGRGKSDKESFNTVRKTLGKDDQAEKSGAASDAARDMYDFFRVGYEGEFRKEKNPVPEIIKRAKKEGDPSLARVLALVGEHCKKYPDVDMERYNKCVRVAFHNTMRFFLSPVPKFSRHKGLPMAGFHGPLSTYNPCHMLSDNVVHIQNITWKHPAGYEQIFAHQPMAFRKHNVCMVCDEFVEKLVGGLWTVLAKQGLGAQVAPGQQKM